MPKLFNRCVLLIFTVALTLFVITASIALPIYCRPFYYAHIDALELVRFSGFTHAQIRGAYDAVLDYLTLPNRPFSTGVMGFSPEGAAHFADCKVLFDLNAKALMLSWVVLLIIFVLRCCGKVPSLRRSAHYAGAAAITIPLVVGALGVIDFDRTFVIFHKIFFPGKTNWLFNPMTDEIILVLPQQFFMNCAILIGAGILLSSLGLLWLGRKRS